MKRIREKKGPSRPVNNIKERSLMLSSIKPVDEVLHFSTDEELENMVKSIKPDIMVVGSDWKGKPVIGSQYALELKFFNRIDGYSTTKTIQNIINRRDM